MSAKPKAIEQVDLSTQEQAEFDEETEEAEISALRQALLKPTEWAKELSLLCPDIDVAEVLAGLKKRYNDCQADEPKEFRSDAKPRLRAAFAHQVLQPQHHVHHRSRDIVRQPSPEVLERWQKLSECSNSFFPQPQRPSFKSWRETHTWFSEPRVEDTLLDESWGWGDSPATRLVTECGVNVPAWPPTNWPEAIEWVVSTLRTRRVRVLMLVDVDIDIWSTTSALRLRLHMPRHVNASLQESCGDGSWGYHVRPVIQFGRRGQVTYGANDFTPLMPMGTAIPGWHDWPDSRPWFDAIRVFATHDFVVDHPGGSTPYVPRGRFNQGVGTYLRTGEPLRCRWGLDVSLWARGLTSAYVRAWFAVPRSPNYESSCLLPDGLEGCAPPNKPCVWYWPADANGAWVDDAAIDTGGWPRE